ncbi:MAG TPA: hypothetical protein VF618_11690 [Thermoanaerobaculia bacterium]
MEIGNPPRDMQLAALVTAPDHEATLRIDKRYLDKDHDNIGTKVGNNICFPLTGCVTLPDLGSGAVGRLLIDEIPSLLTVTNGTTLTAELHMCPPDPAVFRAVVYLPPGGRLAPRNFFKHEVKFGANPHGPLPQGVLYHVATGAMIRFDIDGHLVDLKEGAEVVIANVCSKSTGNHFQNYKKLFNPKATVVDDPKATVKCQFGVPLPVLPDCGSPQDLDVDCANSRLP